MSIGTISAARRRSAAAGVWTFITTPDVTTSGTGSNTNANTTIRQWFNTAILVSGSKIRITFRSGTGGNLVVSNAYIQTKGAGKYDFSATPVPITFDGGSAGFTVGASTIKVSDEIPFTVTGSDQLVVAVAIGSPGNNYASNTGATANHGRATKAGSDASTLVASGYSTFNENVMHLKLEVYH